MVSWSKILGLVSITGATGFLGLVAFDVPYLKTVYLLKVELPTNGTTLPGNTRSPHPFITLDGHGLQCSPAQIGYSLAVVLNGTGNEALNKIADSIANATKSINGTLPGSLGNGEIGDALSDASKEATKFLNGTLPDAVNKGVDAISTALTKVLFVHVVAFGIAVVSLLFALLAFFGAPIAECCSCCFCGFASAATFAVFAFDIAFYEIIKRRLNAQNDGTTAIMGNAVWITGTAMLLLFITPILFLVGRCCACCFSGANRKLYDKEYSSGHKGPNY
ncbi:hypothetical protein C8J57DRAFT_1257743 [Mycena rebaudengoi]|nr:hypothetical protein C8J57DRAFT_1257743 [Mycena rebaudengoi]